MHSGGTIRFHFPNKGVTLRERSRLKDFIAAMLKKHRRKIDSISYVFCSDEYLLEINRKYLQHNWYTDIITFELSEQGQEIVADIYVSVDRVRDNARVLGVPLILELHRVIFHGVLHLCGYEDKSLKGKQLMRVKEDYYLNRYFVPRENPKS